MTDHLSINRANWDSRVPQHLLGYDLDRFRADPSFLSGVVRFDRPRLGEISGRRGIHLQCHIGTDTVSLARLGARMTGLDLSPASLAAARSIAEELGHDIEYVESDVDRAVEALGAERFEFVYTGIGALCWVPNVRHWARTVAALLVPGGRLFLRDAHPMVYTLCDPRADGLLTVEFPYFETPGIVFEESQTYAGDGTPIASPRSISFNHGISELLNAVIDAGLELVSFEEHDSVPWNPFGDFAEFDPATGEYRLRDRPARVPTSFTLRAVRPRTPRVGSPVDRWREWEC